MRCVLYTEMDVACALYYDGQITQRVFTLVRQAVPMAAFNCYRHTPGCYGYFGKLTELTLQF